MPKAICIILASLCILSNAVAATISLLVTGTITKEWSQAYPGVQIGDAFRISVTYTEGAPDPFAPIYTGQYFPEDLRMILEILGKGMIFQGEGGTVLIGIFLEPGIPSYQAINFHSSSSDGNGLSLVFSDYDGSFVHLARHPVDYSTIDEYESVEFTISNFSQFGLELPSSLDGTVNSVVVPEPQTLVLLGASLMIGILRTKRYDN